MTQCVLQAIIIGIYAKGKVKFDNPLPNLQKHTKTTIQKGLHN